MNCTNHEPPSAKVAYRPTVVPSPVCAPPSVRGILLVLVLNPLLAVAANNVEGIAVFPKGLGDMAGMMKQAMQMKSKMAEFKEQLAEEVVEATAGGGMVTVTVNGKMELLSVVIDPEVIDKDEPEMLATLVQAAVNEGIAKVQQLIKSKMSELTGGMDIPDLM
jgi:nucleoid-associated protein EbfC